MPDLLTNLGLRANTSLNITGIPNYAPHFLLANFLFTYVVSSTRFIKLKYKIDNNISPRGDLDTRGERAVSEGKMTAEQLAQIRRLQSAHENGMEHYSVFVAAITMAVQAGLPAEMVNKYALIYTLVRIAYTAVYVTNTTRQASGVRSVLWWAGNVACIRLLWFAGKAFNMTKVL